MQRKIVPVLFVSILLQTVSHLIPHDYTTLCPASCTCNYRAGVATTADCSGRNLFSVPGELPRSLQKLLLSNNNISHLECHDLSYMSKLATLDLSHNTLQTLAGSLTKKSNKYECCNYISLNLNLFQIFPIYEDFSMGKYVRKICKTPLFGLTQLQRLILHDNQLSHLDAHTFSGLSSLLYLDLSHNRLTTLDPQSFRGLEGLKNLNLYGNLPSSFPDDLFQDQVKLKVLNIGYDLRDLLYLDSHDSAIHCYPDPDKALSRLENLKILRMYGFRSPCVPGPGFRNLTNLSLLDFSAGSCDVDSLPEYFFSNISSKTNLTTVSFYDCDITFIHNRTFSYIPTLSGINLSENWRLQCRNLFSASESFPETRIKELDLNHINSINYLRLTAATFKYIGNTSLEVLRMANNAILIIDQEVIFALPRSLKVLDLSDNKLLRAEFLRTMPFLINLEILDFSKQIQNKVSIGIDVSNYNMVEESNNGACHILRDGSFNFQTASIGTQTTRQNNHTGMLFSCSDENDQRCNVIKLLSQISEMNTTGKQFAFAQWNLLIKSVCSTYHPTIPTSKLNQTAMTVTEIIIRRLMNAFFNKSLLISSDVTNTDSAIPSIPLPRSLRQLYAEQLKLSYAVPAIKFILNKVLWHLDVSSDMLWCFDGPVLGLNALKILDLSNNFALAISPYFFIGLRNITHLFLSYNILGASFELDVECHILSPLEELKFLAMANSDLRILHSNAFKQNKKLRLIYLSQNSLRHIPRISHLKDLRILDVSFNLIKTLSMETLSDLDTIALTSILLKVNLTGNPLTCDCSSLGFLEWFQKTNISFTERNSYACIYINGTILYLNQSEMFISDLSRICQGQSVFLTSLILFSLTVIIYLVLALTSYYRHRLLFYVYLNKQRFFSHLYELEHQRLSDVFLIYDDQDPNCRQHVLQVVIPNLSRHGLTYHVSEVGLDNPSAGRSIREVVEESVLGGKKTVVLLTAEFFQDDERQLEVSMAKIVEQMLGRRRLLFLVAQKMNCKTLPSHIYHLLTVSRLIPYSPASEQFWIDLAREIRC